MTGHILISMERLRQIDEECFSPEHDDAHTHCELIDAARCYLIAAKVDEMSGVPYFPLWPWEAVWWKPSQDRIRNLVKAGALIAAEIDRLQRRKEEPSDVAMADDADHRADRGNGRGNGGENDAEVPGVAEGHD